MTGMNVTTLPSSATRIACVVSVTSTTGFAASAGRLVTNKLPRDRNRGEIEDQSLSNFRVEASNQ
jgi:hypothetical protein